MSRRGAARVAGLIASGDERLAARDLDGAEAAYLRAWEADKSSADAAWSLGCIASHRHDHVRSLAWAERALELDGDHAGGTTLAGNALLGLGRHEEAIKYLRVASSAGNELATAQLALCLEALGRLAEAEAELRRLLEHDPSYQTRHAPLAWYRHSPFWADVHHVLARVLQGQGALEEARLHYHLTKRIDPETVLDPRYLEIMTTEELEDHPIDRLEIEPVAGADADDFVLEIVRLVRLKDYDEIVAGVAELEREELLPRLSGLIETLQLAGQLSLSARLRMLIDVAAGQDARELFNALEAPSWRRLLDLADHVAAGQLPTEDATRIARAEGAPPYVPTLLWLSERFVVLEPHSGTTVAEMVAAALEGAGPAELAEALRHLARAQLGAGKSLDAQASLRRALDIADAAEDGNVVRKILDRLWRVHMQCKRFDAAEAALRRSIDLADREGDSDGALHSRLDLAALLLHIGREWEAYEVALAVAEVALGGGGGEDLAPRAAAVLEATAERAGERTSDGVLEALRQRSAAAFRAPADELRDAARGALEEGRLPDAVDALERALDLADFAGTRRDQALALLDLGHTLARAGRAAEARTRLEQGLLRAEPEGRAVDVWPALMQLSLICEQLKDQASAISVAERALAVAERAANPDREADSHEWLGRLLIDSKPDLAVHHYGRSLRSSGGTGSPSQAWDHAIAAASQGRYAEALEGFEAVAATDPVHRAAALSNSARARVGLGDMTGAASAFGHAHEAFAAEGNRIGALEALAALAALQSARAAPTEATLAQMRTEFAALTAPHELRAGGLLVGAAAMEAYDNAFAEEALRVTLHIATSIDWADIEHEIAARRLLGTLYRRVGRNAEAEEQYRAAIVRALYIRDERAEGDLRGRLGIALRQLGRLEEALVEYDRAIEIGVLSGAAGEVALHKMNRASTLFELGRDEAGRVTALEAWRDFEDLGEVKLAERTILLLEQNVARDSLPPEVASRIDEVLADVLSPNLEPVTLSRRALARLAMNDVSGARGDLDEAVNIFRARGDRVEEARALLNRARVLGQLDLEGALADVDHATAIASVLENAELEVDAIDVRVELTLAADKFEEAIDALRALDRGLSLMRRRLSQDTDRVALAGRAAERFRDHAVVLAHHDHDALAVALLELARARGLDDLLTAMTEDSQAWSDPFDLEPARAALAELGDGVIAVGFDVLPGGVAVTVIPPSGPPSLRLLDLAYGDVERLMAAFRHEVIDFRGRAAQTWTPQAARLLACITEDVKAASTVVLLPDGPLHELPLHAVPMPDGRPLLKHARVLYAPSLHALVHLHRRTALPPDDPLTTIATVGVAFPDEARAIALRIGGPCLSGRSLDKERVREVARRAKVLHFACHGFFDGRMPQDSGLLLTTAIPPRFDHILSVRDVTAWNWRSDLVTLSACETGLGQVVPADFVGLARAFVGAGAGAVIAALWPVDDAATQRLMIALYEEVERQRRADKHVDAAEALRVAQLACSDGSLLDWAAFKLIGWPHFEWEASR